MLSMASDRLRDFFVMATFEDMFKSYQNKKRDSSA